MPIWRRSRWGACYRHRTSSPAFRRGKCFFWERRGIEIVDDAEEGVAFPLNFDAINEGFEDSALVFDGGGGKTLGEEGEARTDLGVGEDGDRLNGGAVKVGELGKEGGFLCFEVGETVEEGLGMAAFGNGVGDVGEFDASAA